MQWADLGTGDLRVGWGWGGGGVGVTVHLRQTLAEQD